MLYDVQFKVPDQTRAINNGAKCESFMEHTNDIVNNISFTTNQKVISEYGQSSSNKAVVRLNVKQLRENDDSVKANFKE